MDDVNTAQAEKKSDFDSDVRRWLSELKEADKREEDWRKMGGKVEKRYRGESQAKLETFHHSSIHNILWANVETLRPTLYNRTPRPDVRRRFRDNDPVGRQVSEILNRCLSFSMDSYDFDDVILNAVLDYLLPGRGVVRVKYVPSISKKTEEVDGAQKEYDSLDFEDVVSELVPWEDFRIGPGKTWEDVSWIAFLHRMTREELVEKFGETIGKEVSLDETCVDEEANKITSESEVFKRARIWEIYDKETKKIIYIAESYKNSPLSVLDNPLEISTFFPVPRPLYAVSTTSTTVPIPEYYLYEDQAVELDRLTSRIHNLIEACRVSGVYDGSITEIPQMLEAEENVLIPATNAVMIGERGGFDKAIWMLPLEQFSKTLSLLYAQREQVIQTIYEITGLSDILRGVSNPNETAKAQEIKRQFGGKRIERRQRDIQRFIRDLLRIKVEVITKKFSKETIEKMSGIAITPEIEQLLRQDTMRAYRIDIETNSTIAFDEQEDKEQLAEVMGAIGQYVSLVGPMVQQGVFPMEVAKGVLTGILRRYRLGKELEEMLEQPMPQQQKPDPEMVKAQNEQQKMQMELQLEQQKAQSEQQLAQSNLQIEQQKMQMEMQKTQLELQMKQQEMQSKMAMDKMKMENDIALEREKTLAQLQLEKEKMGMEMELERQRCASECQMKEQEMVLKASQLQSDNHFRQMEHEQGEKEDD